MLSGTPSTVMSNVKLVFSPTTLTVITASVHLISLMLNCVLAYWPEGSSPLTSTMYSPESMLVRSTLDSRRDSPAL